MFIASFKIPESEGSVSSSSFYGQLPDYLRQVFSLTYPVDGFQGNEDVESVQDIILFFCVWCELRELGGRSRIRNSQ